MSSLGRISPFRRPARWNPRSAGSDPGALHRQHRERAAEQGEEHRQRRHHRHLGAGPRHDRLAVHHANRTALLGRACPGDADRRRPRRHERRLPGHAVEHRVQCRHVHDVVDRRDVDDELPRLHVHHTARVQHHGQRAVRVIDPGLREGGDPRERGRQRHEHRHGGRDLDGRPVRGEQRQREDDCRGSPDAARRQRHERTDRLQDADRAGAHLGRHGASGLGSQRRRGARIELLLAFDDVVWFTGDSYRAVPAVSRQLTRRS